APTPKPTVKPSTTGTLPSAYNNLIQGSSSSWTSSSSNTGSLDTAVAGGTRAKYTQILGGGQDTVTIMIYMCGTDLESRSSMATRDLVEMTRASLSDNVHVIVYTGGCKKWNNQIISAQTNQIYEIKRGGLEPLDTNRGNAVMTDPSTLSGFISWCAQHFPANRNELILWDHGGGSVSGYGYDEKYASSGSMSLAGINQALATAGVKFDFIGFDACLMATMENGLMLDKYADYMIASEETEPGIGWYYTNWLTELSNNTSKPTVEVGKKIVDDFVTTCASQCSGQSATLSVVDLAELAATAPEPMKDFSKSLTELITNNQYRAVSNARNGTREFARSTAIDQIDLVHFARNVGNSEGKALTSALLGAVKYNRTSSDMSNSYGISIYFPYRRTSNVDKAVTTYNAIGMDESYSECIREFASLEASGQAATGGSYNALPSLLGSLYGGNYTSGAASSYSSSYSSADMIGTLLNAFLGGNTGMVPGLSGANARFLARHSLSAEDTLAYIEDNFFDAGALAWTENADGETVISLPEDQWALVEGLDLNMFYDDGEGYIDMGLDNVFDFDDEGNLLAPTDRTWLAVDGQPVAYYHEYTSGEGDDRVITGYIPAYLNGERVELLVTFDAANPHGAITGVRTVYLNGETETVAKSFVTGDDEDVVAALQDGDVIDFVCDYYTYDGEYENSYYLGDPLTVSGQPEISNVDVGDGSVRLTYRFTDLYQQHYWTQALVG
ncbi:MAG: peptidase C11, partial [Oscillospiraceae bacterium]|nr:peptidase C11 [Oscillospiraceae bacterium]